MFGQIYEKAPNVKKKLQNRLFEEFFGFFRCLGVSEPWKLCKNNLKKVKKSQKTLDFADFNFFFEKLAEDRIEIVGPKKTTSKLKKRFFDVFFTF